MKRLVPLLLGLVVCLGVASQATEIPIFTPLNQRKVIVPMEIDRQKGVVAFEVPGPLVQLDKNKKRRFIGSSIILGVSGAGGKKWIQLHDARRGKQTRDLGGLLSSKIQIPLKQKDGKKIEWVNCFKHGVLFCSMTHAVVYDWEAVRQWEDSGGYAKHGFPKRDKYRVWSPATPSKIPAPPHSTI